MLWNPTLTLRELVSIYTLAPLRLIKDQAELESLELCTGQELSFDELSLLFGGLPFLKSLALRQSSRASGLSFGPESNSRPRKRLRRAPGAETETVSIEAEPPSLVPFLQSLEELDLSFAPSSLNLEVLGALPNLKYLKVQGRTQGSR